MEHVPFTEVEKVITEKIEELLMVGEGHVDLDTPLGVYGVDSLMKVALIDEVESRLGLVVPVSELDDNPTVRHIACHVHDAVGGGRPRPASGQDWCKAS